MTAAAVAPSPRDALNRALAARYRAGDRGAGDELCRVNEGLIVRYARWTLRAWRLPDHCLPDLVQCGRLGLLRAAEDFDPGRGLVFVTYAGQWVRSFAGLGARRETMIRVPSCATSRKATREDREMAGKATGLRAFGAAADDGDPDGDAIRMLSVPDAVEAVADADERDALLAALGRALGGMPERERAVIVRRYGLDGRPPELLREIAARLGVSKQCIAYTQTAALRRLRLAMGVDIREVG